LKFKKSLEFVNDAGVNEDRRGSDHTKIRLPFEETVIVPKETNLYDFAVACYLIKSHKFDYWYEFFGGIDLADKTSFYKINLGFDHGS
jgi:hypothetical protein